MIPFFCILTTWNVFILVISIIDNDYVLHIVQQMKRAAENKNRLFVHYFVISL